MLKQQVTNNNLAIWSIYHPIGVMVIALAVIVVSLFTLKALRIDLLPNIIYPEIRVRVLDSGVPAMIMEDQVTRQLEEQLAVTEEAIGIQSVTNEGKSSVDLLFPYGTDMDVALRDASTRLDRAKRYLPDTIQPPTIYKRDPSQIPVLEFAISSPLINPIDLRTWVDYQLSKWFINLPGVASTEVGGGLIREIQVLPDPQRLAAFGLTVDNISQALQQDNVEKSGGRLYMPEQEITTRLLGRWQSVEELAQVPLSTPQHPVYLGEVAQILDTHQEERLKIRLNNTPGIKLSIQKQPQANTVDVADTVMQRIDWLKQQQLLPDNTQINIVSDQSIYIRYALQNAALSGLSGALLAMIVVYLFLGNLRHTLIIGTAIPLAILVTITLMSLNNLTLNIMSLGGLALGVGMVVDNTIVMLENITRCQVQSQSRVTGAVQAVGEMTSAIIAATTTNLAAIVPFLFIVGLIGLLFRELIFTISSAMIASLVVALTVVPALSALGCDDMTSNKANRALFYYIEIGLEYIYGWFISFILKMPWLVILIFGISLWFAIPSFVQSKQIFLPDLDNGQVRVDIIAETGIALDKMDQITQQIETILQAQPEVATVFTQMGGMVFGRSEYESSNRSSLTVQLQPSLISTKDWIKRVDAIIAKLQLIGVKVRLSSVGIRGIRLGKGDEAFSLRIQGDNLQQLARLADEVVKKLSDIKGLKNLKHNAEEVSQEFAIRIDRQRAHQLGFNLEHIGNTLNTLMNGKIVTDFIDSDRRFNVRLRLPYDQLRNLQDLQSLLLYNETGRTVRLDEIATVDWIPVPTEIMRDQQQRIVEISAEVTEENSLINLFNQVQQRLIDLNLPKGYTFYEGGAVEALQEGQQLTLALLGLAIFLVFVVMAVQYESLRNPFVILLSIPFSGLGVAIGIMIFELPLSMPVWLGMIMLAGMIVNNAIILVETIELQRIAGNDLHSAIMQAGKLRLRPILMTTITTVVGLLPLAVGWGEGAEMLQPLAITIVFGLSFSLLVSLLLVPACYMVIQVQKKTPERDIHSDVSF